MFPGQGAQYVGDGPRPLRAARRSSGKHLDACCERAREAPRPRPAAASSIPSPAGSGGGGGTAEPDRDHPARALRRRVRAGPALDELGRRAPGHDRPQHRRIRGGASGRGASPSRTRFASWPSEVGSCSRCPRGRCSRFPSPRRGCARLLREGLSLAAVNAPSFCVVSGPTPAIEALEEELQRRDRPTTRLHTSHAFHSAMMDPILEPFREALSASRFAAPKPLCLEPDRRLDHGRPRPPIPGTGYATCERPCAFAQRYRDPGRGCRAHPPRGGPGQRRSAPSSRQQARASVGPAGRRPLAAPSAGSRTPTLRTFSPASAGFGRREARCPLPASSAGEKRRRARRCRPTPSSASATGSSPTRTRAFSSASAKRDPGGLVLPSDLEVGAPFGDRVLGKRLQRRSAVALLRGRAGAWASAWWTVCASRETAWSPCDRAAAFSGSARTGFAIDPCQRCSLRPAAGEAGGRGALDWPRRPRAVRGSGASRPTDRRGDGPRE